MTVAADSSRLDASGGLANPIGLTMEPVLEAGFLLLLDKGAIPGAFQGTIRIPGNVRNHPLDGYRTTLVVVRAVATRRRKQEMTMTPWFAALIFALLPLRLGLPGAPPLGSWIDVLVYFWVLIAVMIGLVWWILVWLRSGPKAE